MIRSVQVMRPESSILTIPQSLSSEVLRVLLGSPVDCADRGFSSSFFRYSAASQSWRLCCNLRKTSQTGMVVTRFILSSLPTITYYQHAFVYGTGSAYRSLPPFDLGRSFLENSIAPVDLQLPGFPHVAQNEEIIRGILVYCR